MEDKNGVILLSKVKKMKKTFLLKNKNAEKLYENVAKNLPIIDYHNHLAIADIEKDKKYSNLYELWIGSDPYKHRLMRIRGIEEEFITGNAEPREKFKKFCSAFPFLVGSPVYDWSRMELNSIFSLKEEINAKNANYIYDKCGEMLSSAEYSAKGILKKFNVENLSPVATILEDLTPFNGKTVTPSLRGDDMLSPTEEFKCKLSLKTGATLESEEDYFKAITTVLDEFHKKGCRVADHSLDSGFFDNAKKGDNKVKILSRLANEYAKRGWTLLLHFGAKRKTSERLMRLAGPAGGYAAVGEGFNLSALCDFLGETENKGLPDIVLFPLNMADQPAVSVMQGSFSEDNVPSKVQLGPAWWWCDHALGIKNTLDCISSFGVLSEFIGMTTDSRSILSLTRHDYFRRIFCSYLTEKNSLEEWGASEETLREIVKKVCYQNAKNKILKV